MPVVGDGHCTGIAAPACGVKHCSNGELHLASGTIWHQNLLVSPHNKMWRLAQMHAALYSIRCNAVLYTLASLLNPMSCMHAVLYSIRKGDIGLSPHHPCMQLSTQSDGTLAG